MLNPIQKEFHAEKNIAAREDNSYNPRSFRARTCTGAKARSLPPFLREDLSLPQ